MKKNFKFWLILLIIVFFIPLFDLFRPGLPLSHDGRDHTARIANFYQSLSEGNLIPRWAGNLNWGYGHPILMFLYPLPSYAGSLFRFLGFSFVASTKIVFGLSFLLSGIFMFLWIKEIWGKEAGLASAVLYLFAPYRFVDLYVRGAIGECWAFVWPPLVCWFILKLARKKQWKYLLGGSLSLAALILSHNALSLMFLPIIFGYGFFLAWQSSQKKKSLMFLFFGLVTLFGFSLSAFFWLPALYEGKYTLREIVTKGNITGFTSFSRLFYSPWDYGGSGNFSLQLGFLQWSAVGLIVVFGKQFLEKRKKEAFFLLFLLFCFLAAVFLVLSISEPLYLKIGLLQKFQFAWRFLSLAVFPPAVFGGALVFLLPEKLKKIGAGLVLIISLFLTGNYWHPKDFLYLDESFFTAPYPGTTDTGESAPRWSVRFMEDYPQTAMEVIEGEAEIENIERKSNYHFFEIRAKKKSRLVENTLYFPGWNVLIDGQKTEIEFQDPSYRGLITFWVEPGDHQVEVLFKETKFRLFSDLISLFGLGGLVLAGIIKRKIGLA